jgi:hypothetical protein
MEYAGIALLIVIGVYIAYRVKAANKKDGGSVGKLPKDRPGKSKQK